MPKAWVYRVEMVLRAASLDFDETIESVLNEYGAEGWEAFSAIAIGESAMRILLRRPVE